MLRGQTVERATAVGPAPDTLRRTKTVEQRVVKPKPAFLTRPIAPTAVGPITMGRVPS